MDDFFVEHPSFGIGIIVSTTDGNNVNVFFNGRNAAVKMKPNAVKPCAAPQSEIIKNHLLSQRVPTAVTKKGKNTPKTVKSSWDQVIADFLKKYPEGFQDSDFFFHECGYKIAASENFREKLSQSRYDELLTARKFSQIAETFSFLISSANRGINKDSQGFNIVSWHESDTIKDAFALHEDNCELFANALYALLYSANKETAFDEFSDLLHSKTFIGGVKKQSPGSWPICTAPLFLQDYIKYTCSKPQALKDTAGAFNYSGLDTTQPPTWKKFMTHIRLMELIHEELLERQLTPQNMLHIQGFIYVVTR